MNDKLAFDDPKLNLIDVSQFVQYLKTHSWKQVAGPYSEFMAFEHSQGPKIKIILPVSHGIPEAKQMIATAINLLAAINQTAVESLIDNISIIDIDSMKIRVKHQLIGQGRIGLDYASELITHFHNLIAYATGLEASVEHPAFYRRLPHSGLSLAHRCFLGQSFSGSYGFTIECPMPRGQLEFLTQPLERRTMIRIAKGLLLTIKAQQENNGDIIVDGLSQGFNANMCEVVLAMFKTLMSPEFEYEIVWANQWGLKVSDDLRKTIRLDSRSCQYLEYAAAKLRKDDEPKNVRICGKVIGWKLDSEEPVGGLEHVVTILWRDESERDLKVRVGLTAAQFPIVKDAIDGRNLIVEGVLERNGNTWHLYDSKNVSLEA